MRQRIKSLLSSRLGSDLLIRAGRYPLPRAFLRRLSYPRIAFANFDEAWEAAGEDRYAGHETESIDIHMGLMEKLRPSDPNVLKHLNVIASRGCMSVLDFGGNVGNVYYSYRPHLPGAAQLDWTVVDLAAVTSVGARLARERNVAELRFKNSLQEATGNFDVLLASGSLHYWEESIASWLKSLPQLPPHVIVNRSPVHESHPTFITVQQTKTYAVPCVVHNRSELVDAFAQHGYSLVDAWAAPELSLTFTFFPALSVPQYSGFYFRRDKSPAA
jgi:putative methyltransferase (TIGR04325 family)